MFLLPLWPKETLKFPLIAAALVAGNLLAFLITWPMQVHQTKRVGQDDFQRAAQKLAGAVLDSDSGLNEADRGFVTSELAVEPFPSPQLIEFFKKIQADPSLLKSQTRYEWDLIHPLYESYQRSVQKNPGGGMTVFKRWGFNPEQSWFPGLITHQFLHEGMIHLVFNMLFLWIAASIAEATMGAHALWLYLAGGVAAAFTQVQFGIPSGGILLGASGPISALLGFCLITNPNEKVKLFYWVLFRGGVFDSPLWFFLAIWVLSQILLATVAAHGAGDAVAYAAHLGGFVFGCLIGIIWRSFQDPPTAKARP